MPITLKRTVFSLAAVALLGGTVYLGTITLSTTTVASTPDNNKTLATYGDGKKVLLSDVNDKLRAVFGDKMPNGVKSFSDIPADMQRNIIQSYITSILLSEKAIEEKLNETDLFKVRKKELEVQVLQQLLVEKIQKDFVTDDRLRQAHDKLVSDWADKEEVKARHILVSKEEEAKNIAQELKDGATFDDLAKKHSLDTGNKEKGGDLGYFTKGQMVKPFEEVVFSLKTGDISDPVQTPFGWHVIKLEDRRPKPAPAFDDVKEKLTQQLSQQVTQEYLDKLLQRANIQIN